MNELATYKGSVIYKATNLINKKIYVGKAINFSNRYKQHKWASRKAKTAFSSAIAKYGFENFQFEILEYCEADKLYIQESYWILKLGSLNSLIGYNLRVDLIGRSGFSHTDETKKKISDKCKGVIPWHAGKKVGNLRSKEGIQRFSQQMIGGKNPQAKTVYQFTKDGQFIKEFDSASTAARELNIGFKGICRIAAGQKPGDKKRKSYKGFKWSYNKPDLAVMQESYLFNCWELLTDNAEDNQQRSLSNKERSTTIAEMRVGTSVPKQETSLGMMI